MSSKSGGSFRPGDILAPLPEVAVKYNCRVKYYPDNQIKITCFSRSIFNPDKAEEVKKTKKEESLLEYDPETDTMAYKYIQGKTIYNPFTNSYEPITCLTAFEVTKNGLAEIKEQPRADSIKRTIDKAFEIGLANDFRYFVTLTLDASKIDRYDPSKIYPALRRFHLIIWMLYPFDIVV